MKNSILFMLVFLITGVQVEAQLLDKLKQRAKEKGLETREVSFDTAAYNKDMNHNYVEEVELETLRDFFTTDVFMALYNKEGKLVQRSFFDANVIAMRTVQVTNPSPIYHDKKGMFYGYNDKEGRYEKMSILPASSMGFMMAGMTTSIYKLPPEPYYEAFTFLSEKDIALNFIILELAFIYKPQHFMDDDLYSAENVTCNELEHCIRFNYNDPEYEGSYIQFDEKGRLVEFYINSTSTQFSNDTKNSSGKFVYSYQECQVELPDAVEQSMVPGPLGKMLNLERGLEPWKHNKKDKKNNNKL
ncbi:hypothetical protein ACS386_12055 [Flavobacteriaceae bacterium LMO-SS05]